MEASGPSVGYRNEVCEMLDVMPPGTRKWCSLGALFAACTYTKTSSEVIPNTCPVSVALSALCSALMVNLGLEGAGGTTASAASMGWAGPAVTGPVGAGQFCLVGNAAIFRLNGVDEARWVDWELLEAAPSELLPEVDGAFEVRCPMAKKLEIAGVREGVFVVDGVVFVPCKSRWDATPVLLVLASQSPIGVAARR